MTAKLYNLDKQRHSEYSGGKRWMMNSDRSSQTRQIPCPPLPDGDTTPKTPGKQPWIATNRRAIRKQSHSSLCFSVPPSKAFVFAIRNGSATKTLSALPSATDFSLLFNHLSG